VTKDAVVRAFDLVVVGEAPLDLVLDVRPPIKRPGGAMYSACAAAAVGARVGVVSEVGLDEIGELYPKVRDLPICIKGIQQLNTKGLCYVIENANEVIPQVVTAQGSHLSAGRRGSFPMEYVNTRCLLLYPHNLDLLLEIAAAVRSTCGKVFLDLQHDISDLSDCKEIIGQCDVVLASRQELLDYTNVETETEAVEHLRQLGASIVVVKYGMGGSAIYAGERERILIPAYLANFRCTIGAGDVYNAIFALQNASGASLQEAGSRAAVAASVFAEHMQFDDYIGALSKLSFEKEIRSRTPVVAHPEQLAHIQIYLAGHFLSTPMRMWVDRVALALESRGFSVFSPYRDAGVLDCSADAQRRITCFLRDLEGLGNSQAVVALLDGLGRGGTSWEIGYAYAKCIPVFGLGTDPLQPLSNMVEQSCRVIEPTVARLLNDLFASLGTTVLLPSD
jgi:sugar/nucleoside kinase (ribokinase family)/nucleoside 2-deoxyribosyltransferase